MDRSRHAHMQLWLQGCRWLIAIGLVMTVVAGSYIVFAQNRNAVTIVPEKVNPNTAPAASLIRLPGIGKARAIDIVEWRTARPQPAFKSAASLEAIRGIGPKTSEALSEWLTFEPF